MKTEQITETETVNVNLETVNPETETKKSTRKSTRKNQPIEIESQKQIGNSIPKTLFITFPETETLYKRLATYGLKRFKFDFGFSTKSTGKRNIVIEYRFFDLPLPSTKNEKTAPADLLKSINHQITGKLYFKLFPEIKTLFNRLEKQINANNFRLNISYVHHTTPQKIREHIIKSDAPSTYHE